MRILCGECGLQLGQAGEVEAGLVIEKHECPGKRCFSCDKVDPNCSWLPGLRRWACSECGGGNLFAAVERAKVMQKSAVDQSDYHLQQKLVAQRERDEAAAEVQSWVTRCLELEKKLAAIDATVNAELLTAPLYASADFKMRLPGTLELYPASSLLGQLEYRYPESNQFGPVRHSSLIAKSKQLEGGMYRVIVAVVKVKP